SYTLTYTVADPSGNASSLTRTVNVVDTTEPVLALLGAEPMTVECHTPFADPGAAASDACSGDLTSSIHVTGTVDANTVGSYTLTVNVVDTTEPVLALLGAEPMTVECHSPFADPGATASDACSGDLTSFIHVTGTVDANTVGSYTLTYSVTDPSGNTSSVTRTV